MGCWKPVVTGATKGRNGCIFAYGQTGSGKTHTVVGGDSFRARGDWSRALPDLPVCLKKANLPKFPCPLRSRKFMMMCCTTSSIPGTPGENVDDWVKARVLEDSGIAQGRRLGGIRGDDRSRRVTAAVARLRTAEDGPDEANDLSSRSHAVFTLYVFDEEASTRAKLHLVDLAGSGASRTGRRTWRRLRAGTSASASTI